MRISAVVLTKNEEDKIGDCLKSLSWTDEILVVDTGSSDKTLEIARKHKAKVYSVDGGSFNYWRNEGLRFSKGDWILYLDADERITPLLRKEIESIINAKKEGKYTAYAIPRKNIILGREMKHGGWWPDYVKRLFKRKHLEKWEGKVHEEPVFEGKIGHLENSMVHIKETDISDMVAKTNRYSEIEAELLFKANHPKMSWWRFLRIMLGELWYRLIIQRGFLDGAEGVIFSFYQSWSKFVTYAKLWELQIDKTK